MAPGIEKDPGRAPTEAEKLRIEEELIERNRPRAEAEGRTALRRFTLTAVTMVLVALALWLMMH
jgi:hypothetical protein